MKNELEQLIKEGEALIKSDKYPDALRVFAKAYMLDTHNELVAKCIAFLWQRINDGNYDFDPETAEEFIMRGNARLYKQEYDSAFNDYSKAIEIDDKCDYAYKCKGFVLALQGKHQEALKEYVIATKLKPDIGEYWDDAATSFEAIQDIYKAHACHETAVRKSPDDARIWYNYAVFFVKFLQDAKEALKCLDKAIEIYPNFEDAIVNRDHLLKIMNSKE